MAKLLDLRFRHNDDLCLTHTAELEEETCFMWGGNWVTFETYLRYRLSPNTIPPVYWGPERPEQLDLL